MFWLYALLGLNAVIPLAVLPYLVRVLGVERFGLVAFAQAFAQYFVILTDYGFNLSATKQTARVRNNREKVSRLFWSVIEIKLVLTIAGAFVMGLILAFVPRFRADAILYEVAYVAVVGTVLFPVWLFQGMEQMRYISLLSGGAKVLSALLIFLLVHHRSDYLLALAIQSGGLLVAGIVGFWSGMTHFKISFRQPSRADLKESLRDGWHLFVSNAAGTLYATTNVFLVGLVAGNVQAGYFSAAEKIVRSIQGLLVPIAQAIYPHISELASRSRDLALAFIRKSLVWIGVLSFAPSVLLLLFARPIALILLGKAAEGSVSPLRWIAMLPFIIAVSGVLAVQTMIPLGMEKQLSRIYVVAGISSLMFSLPLIHRYGASGGGAGVLIVEVCIVLAMWTVLKRNGIDLSSEAVVGVARNLDSSPKPEDVLSC